MLEKVGAILEKVFPCEYRDKCLAKPKTPYYMKEFYKSCRMTHQDNCVSAKIYKSGYQNAGFQLASKLDLIDDIGLPKRIEEMKNE